MSKVFYDHIILLDELLIEIDLLTITDQSKSVLKKEIDAIMHHEILTIILRNLPKEHHEAFLIRFHHAPYDMEHIQFLSEKSGKDMHKELFLHGEKIKNDLKKEIYRHKKK